MYAHCLFCNAHLGTNEALEAFRVGRRLAYDAEKGRLWVVCRACGRWNLTPLEERWEAIEEAERLYRGTRLRASTDHVGLARVADGLDLVRVGRPLRPEFAAWRYGSQFVRRRRVARARWGAGRVVGLGVAAASLAFAGPFGVLTAISALDFDAAAAERRRLTRPLTTRIRIAGTLVHVDVPPADAHVVAAPGGPEVSIPWGRGRRSLAGGDALRVLAGLMRHVNATGASAADVDFAVQRLARVSDLARFLSSLERRTSEGPRRRRPLAADDAPRGLLALGGTDRLALEMLLNEDAERRALDGELAALDQAWRDAEEIAAIADGLALPPHVESAWERLRPRVNPSA